MPKSAKNSDFDFNALSTELLNAYESPLKQGVDPFRAFRRINDTFRLCCHEAASEKFLKSFHRILEHRMKSSIRSSNVHDIKNNSDIKSITEKNIFYEKRESSNISELILNIFQIERTLIINRFDIDDYHIIKFDRDIRNHNGWIEEAYLNEVNELSNTFFLPIIYERVTSRRDYFSNNTKNSEFSSNIFEDIFLSLEKGPYSESQKAKTKNFVRALDRHSPDLFDNTHFKALAAIHHEISENALSHAIRSKINHHFKSSVDKSYFGSIAYLKIQLFHISKNVSERETFHPNFSSFHNKIRLGKYNFTPRKTRRYMSISYCDTGLGIQDHLSRFSGDHENQWNAKTIDNVIEERGTTRNFSGSGFGLRKTKKFASQLQGFLSIDTPQSTYSYNGVTGQSMESAGRTKRGTMISIVIPA